MNKTLSNHTHLASELILIFNFLIYQIQIIPIYIIIVTIKGDAW